MKPLLKSLLVTILGTATLAGWAGVSSGRLFAEKVLTELALPCGLLWVALWTLTAFCFFVRQRRIGVALLLITVVYTLFGGSYQASFFSAYLEKDLSPVYLERCPQFDYVILLGGGTESLDRKHAELSTVGDRVMLAARLYHAGKAKKIVATGESYPWLGSATLSQSSSAKKLLTDLRVPEVDVVELSGQNTSEEFQALSRFFPSTGVRRRIGLITSATHMSRAMRLARLNGLDPQPLPADFEREIMGPIVRKMIPSHEGFRKSSRAFKEFLAQIVGR